MSTANLADFAGVSFGLPLGLPLPGALEAFPPRPMLWRLSLEKKSMTATDGFQPAPGFESMILKPPPS